MIWWTGLAPWEFEFPFPGRLTSTFLKKTGRRRGGRRGRGRCSHPLSHTLSPSLTHALLPSRLLTLSHPPSNPRAVRRGAPRKGAQPGTFFGLATGTQQVPILDWWKWESRPVWARASSGRDIEGEAAAEREGNNLNGVQALKWLKPRPESGRDCLMCAEFVGGSAVWHIVPDRGR